MVCISVRYDGAERVRLAACIVDELGYVSWWVRLDATPAGGPYTISAAQPQNRRDDSDSDSDDADTALTLSNVMFGDVYFCAGQSNMEFQLDQVRTVP